MTGADGMKLSIKQLTALGAMQDRSPMQLHGAVADALERRGLITVETTLTPLGSSRPMRIKWGRLTSDGRALLESLSARVSSEEPA